MVKLPTVIKKNFRILIRSKSSGLIIFLGPLLLILLVGTAFNTSSFYNIKVGSYSSDYNELADSIILKLQEDQYVVTKITEEKDCIDGVKKGFFHICIVFPPNLNVEESPNVDIYVDNSRSNLVYAVKSAILSKVTSRSQELSKDLTSIVVQQLENAKNSLQEKKAVLTDLKNINEGFTSELLTMESEMSAMTDVLTETSVFAQIENKTSIIKGDTNDTREFTELNNLVSSLGNTISVIKASNKNINNAMTGMKSNSIDLGSELADLERTSNRVVSDIEAIQVRDVETLVSPIKTTTQPVSTEKTHINYLFPTLIMMVIMFVSLLLSSITVIREKISSAYFRNFISPTGGVTFVLANYVTNILIILIQLTIVFIVMAVMQPGLISTMANVSIAVIIITTAFILVGMIIGYLFSTEETATVGAISLGTLLLFFSNTIIPIETLSTSIQNIVKYNLFVISDNILRQLILFNSNLSSILPEIYSLLVYIVISGLLIAFIYRFSTEIYNIKKHLKGK